MAVEVKPGARLRSTACETEVVVVKGPVGSIDLRCGGQPMQDASGEATAKTTPLAPFDEPTLVGKRYVNEDESLELLCTKGGAGTLALGDTPLTVKGAKPLPSSD
jgi:hypothetical protein